MPEILFWPVSGHGDLLAVVESGRSEAVEPGGSDPSGSDRVPERRLEILGEIDPENAPPAVVILAVKIDDGIAGPGGPATSLTDEHTLAGLRCSEDDNIGVEVVKLTVPRTRAVGRNGDELAGERNGGTVINGVRRSQSGGFGVLVLIFIEEECGGSGIESRPGLEGSIGVLVS